MQLLKMQPIFRDLLRRLQRVRPWWPRNCDSACWMARCASALAW